MELVNNFLCISTRQIYMFVMNLANVKYRLIAACMIIYTY